jgi:hypothetical protein
MKKYFFTLLMLTIITSCASNKHVYEVNYTEEIEFTGEILTTDFVILKNKEDFNWAVYQTTPIYKELSRKAYFICYDYWGTYKEWKKLSK